MRPASLPLVFAAVAATCGCAPHPQAFAIESVFALGAACDTAGSDLPSSGGLLDVAPGNPQFFVGVLASGADVIKQSALLVSGTTLETADRDRPVITELVANYRLSRRLGLTPKEYVTPVNLPFTTEGTATVVMQLLSPDLGLLLFDGLSPSDAMEDTVDVLVDIEFRGRYSSSGTAFTTGVSTYPLRVFRSTGVKGCTQLQTISDTCNYSGQSTQPFARPALACCPQSTGCN